MARGLATAHESSVVALAMTGDDRAFNELVLRRQARVRDVLRRLCGDAARADDLAQLAFLKAWKALPTLRAPEAFGPWLRAIAVNIWLEDARRAGLDLEPDEALETTADDRAAPARLEARIDLERALARLRPAERLCLVLAHAEGLTHPEIAELAAIPAGTVKSHIARGGEKLRRWLAIGERDD